MALRHLYGCLMLIGAGVFTSLSSADQTTPVQGISERPVDLIALVNGTLVDETGSSYPASLILKDGLIQQIVRDDSLPAGTQIIDMRGKYIYPGFIEPFSQYGLEGYHDDRRGRSGDSGPVYASSRKGAVASNGAIHPQKRWVDHFLPDPEQAESLHEKGFTSAQIARFDGILRGRGATVSLADKLPNDLIYAAETRQFASFDKGSSRQSYPESLMGSIALLRQTLTDAGWYRSAQGKQQTPFTGPLEFNAGLAALAEIQQHGVLFDSEDEQMLLRASRMLQPFEVPLYAIGSGYEYARLAEIKQSGARLILTLDFPAAPDVSSHQRALDVSLADLRHWERAPSNPAMLAEAEIPFAFTSTGLDSEAFWDNLRLAVERGLPKATALAALTTQAAEFAGVEQTAGRLAPGYRADLIISDGDLFTQGRVLSVWTQGQEHRLIESDPKQFEGEYRIEFAELTGKLILDRNGNLSGTLSIGETETELQSLEINREQLSFIADLSAFDIPGYAQFDLTRQEHKLGGKVTLPDGERETFVGIAAKGREEAPAEAAEPDTLIGKLTYPNQAFGVETPLESETLLFRNATLWTSEQQGILSGYDLLIRDGQIEAIGQDLSAPSDATELDATGLHLTAGIVDEHSHIAISRGVNEGTDAITSEVRIGDVLDPDDRDIYLGLAGGTTTSQLLHGSANPIGGQAQIIKLRWGVDAEELKFAQAPGSIKFALGENVKQSNWGDDYDQRYPQSRLGVETIIRDAFQRARDYQRSWAEYRDLGRRQQRQTVPPRKDHRLEALVEILDSQRFIHVHSYVASEMLALIRVAEEFGVTVQTFTHVLEGYKVAEELARHGASASSFADWWAYKFEVYDGIPHNTCLMQNKGVLVSVNSDSNDLQRRLNQEAAKSVMYCGMSQEDAWKLVTINPAKQLKIDQFVGSLREGKQADLVLWDNNPLSVYAKVQSTWVDGVRYFDRQRDLASRDQIQTEKRALIQKVLASNHKRPNSLSGNSSSGGGKGGYKRQEADYDCASQMDTWQLMNLSGGAR